MSINANVDRTKEDYDRAYAAGKQAEYDAFWDAYQDHGMRTNYSIHEGGFGGRYWTDDLFRPKYPIAPTKADMIFRSTSITDLTRADINIDFSKSDEMQYAFAFSKLVKLPPINLSSAFNCTSCFANYKGAALHVIFGEATSVSNTTFSDMFNLVDLTVEGEMKQPTNFQWSTKLTHDSLMSIINALKDYSEDTTGTEWVLTLGSTNIAKLTEAEQLIAEQKGWALK